MCGHSSWQRTVGARGQPICRSVVPRFEWRPVTRVADTERDEQVVQRQDAAEPGGVEAEQLRPGAQRLVDRGVVRQEAAQHDEEADLEAELVMVVVAMGVVAVVLVAVVVVVVVAAAAAVAAAAVSGQRSAVSGQRAAGSGQRAASSGQRAVDSGRWAVGSTGTNPRSSMPESIPRGRAM